MTGIAVDSSALVAILLGEPEAERLTDLLLRHRGDASITAANLLETMLVVEARNPQTGVPDLRTLMEVLAIDVAPVTAELVEIAFRAWKRFGRGRHPAQLNYGDCFAYALAAQLDVPLIFKGEDFSQTDVRSALT